MPTLVHLADEREWASIKKNGIKMSKGRQGIFCMPVLPNFYVSHQWLRELKRRGCRTFIGIYFRLDSDSMVYAGKYNKPHQHITLGAAIKEIMSVEDPLGYELIINRKIEAKEIEKIRSLPANIGWRYMPHSHLEKPTCTCPLCIPRGSIKGRKLREKIEPPTTKDNFEQLFTKLQVEKDEDKIYELLITIGQKRRRSDPNRLIFLLERNSDDINEALAITLRSFRHQNTKAILLQLLESEVENTRTFATFSFMEIYGAEGEIMLKKKNDPVIEEAIIDWKIDN